MELELLHQLKEYLNGEGFAAFVDHMPAAPERAVALYAQDLRPFLDPAGSGVLIHVRGARSCDQAMLDAIAICRALSGFKGELVPGGGWIWRIEPGAPPASAGSDSTGRLFYSMSVRVYW